MKRGEIRWYSFRPPDKRRPVLILARDEVVERLNAGNRGLSPFYSGIVWQSLVRHECAKHSATAGTMIEPLTGRC